MYMEYADKFDFPIGTVVLRCDYCRFLFDRKKENYDALDGIYRCPECDSPDWEEVV